MNLNPETQRVLQAIEQRFHERAFGKEMARVNFLPPDQRRAYLARLRDRIRSRKAATTRPAYSRQHVT